MKLITLLAPASVILLTACGGGGTANQTSFSELVTDYEALGTTAGNAAEFTGELSGDATYDGYFSVIEDGSGDDTPSYLAAGEASVTVDFDSGSVSGSATNFYEVDLATVDFESETEDFSTVSASPIDGELTVSGNGSAISGTLVHLDGEEAAYNLGVDNVEYRGDDGQYLFVDSSGTSTAAGRDDIGAYGEFVGASN